MIHNYKHYLAYISEWTGLENEKANIMLLFYMDSIY